MEQFNSRHRVKIISIADVIFCSLIVILRAAFFFTTALHQSEVNAYLEMITDSSFTLSVFILVVILITLCGVLKIIAAVKLFKSCKTGASPQECYKIWKFWCIANYVFMGVLLSFLLDYRKPFVFVIILNGISVYVVYCYMRELRAFEEFHNARHIIITDHNITIADHNVEVNISGKFDGGGSQGPPPSYDEAIKQQQPPPPQWT